MKSKTKVSPVISLVALLTKSLCSFTILPPKKFGKMWEGKRFLSPNFTFNKQSLYCYLSVAVSRLNLFQRLFVSALPIPFAFNYTSVIFILFLFPPLPLSVRGCMSLLELWCPRCWKPFSLPQSTLV